MDLHQIGTGLGIGSGNYAQQEQHKLSSSTSSSTPSSSLSPSTGQHPQHFQQHHLYNLQSNGSSYPAPTISSWPSSRDLQHQQQQQQQYQPQQSNIKREIMGKQLDTGNGSKNVDDTMPSTSDFVKKLYKFVLASFYFPIGFLYVSVGCWKILPFRI